MKNIVLIGGGNQANCIIDVIEKENKYKIVGIIDSIHDVGSERFGYTIIGRQENLIELVKQYNIDGGIIGIGDNWSRFYVYNKIIEQIPNFEFFNAIHPSVPIGRGVKLGKGIVAMPGCVGVGVLMSGSGVGSGVGVWVVVGVGVGDVQSPTSI